MNPQAKKMLSSLLVFVLVLVLLNFLFSDMDWGIHISIVGSLVVTVIVWLILAGLESARR